MAKGIHLDKKLSDDIMNHFGTTEPDLFGVEVELEGFHVNTVKCGPLWTRHNDGSLRVTKMDSSCCEYVFAQPLNLQDTHKALAILFEALNKPPVEVFDSYRTSIHVHVNCLQESIRTIANFITLAIIFDELFVSQNGETRVGNNFCLRTKDAEGQVEDLIKSVNKYGSLFNLSPHNRYSSVNFSSLLKFGTIEFRSLECTTDLDRVMHWINTVQALKVAARKYADPREIISRFSRHGPIGFMVAHLGKQYEKYAEVPGAHNMLHNGMRLAQDFAYCSEWKAPSQSTSEDKRLRGAKAWKPNNLGGPQFWEQIAIEGAHIPAQMPAWAQALPVGHAIPDDWPPPGALVLNHGDEPDEL